MFEGITCVYRSNVDLYFYVFGSSNENELILASVSYIIYKYIYNTPEYIYIYIYYIINIIMYNNV